MTLFLIVLAAAAGYWTYRRPSCGVWLLVLVLPFDRPLHVGFTLYTTELVLCGVLAGWLLSLLRERRVPTAGRLGLLLGGCFAAALLLSGVNASAWPPVFKQTLRWLEPIFAAAFATDVLCRERDPQTLADVWLTLGTLLSAWGLVQTLAGPTAPMNAGLTDLTLYHSSVMRAYSTFGHPNQFAGYLVLVLPMAWVRAWAPGRARTRLLALGATVMMTAAVICTFSRGAWAGLAVAAVILLFLYAPRRVFAAVMISGMVLAAWLVLSPPPSDGGRHMVWQRIYSMAHPIQESSFHFRRSSTAIALQMAAEHPWLGFGAGEYTRNLKRYLSEESPLWWAMSKHVHNLYLQVLIEAGILGLACFLLWLGYYGFCLVRGWRRLSPGPERILLSGIMVASAAFLIHNTVDVVTIFARGVHFALFLGMGLALALKVSRPAGNPTQVVRDH